MDFMSDGLFDGRPFRILTVVDCHTREALSIASKVSFRAYQVVEVLDQLAKERGRPKRLRVVNALRRDGGRRAGQEISVRECALAA
jgi:putative transposase